MKTFNFTEKNIDIIKHLIFDAAILIDDLNNTAIDKNKEITLYIERRVFEDVKRKRFLFFWHKTYFLGKRAQLKFYNVERLSIIKSTLDSNSTNDFILDINYNKKSNTLSILTAQCDEILRIIFKDELKVGLTDIGDSQIGEGSCFGKVGFTKSEWNSYSKSYF